MPDGISDPKLDKLLRSIPMGQRPSPNGAPGSSSGLTVRMMVNGPDGAGQEVELPVEVATLIVGQSILAELQKLNATLAPFAERFAGKGRGLLGL